MKTNPDLKKLVQMVSGAPEKDCVTFVTTRPELAEEPGALMSAALHGRARLAEKLLEMGADPDATVPSHERYRPLHRAIEHRGIPKNPGHGPTVHLLLEAGAQVELRATWMGLAALATAGMTGDEEMISLIQEQKPKQSLFNAAILAEDQLVAQALTEPSEARLADENNLTPLHYASLSGLREPAHREALARIATLLCEAGADLNSAPPVGPYPSTPVLHFAAWGNNLAVAEVLLARGANPNLGFGNCLWRTPGELAELFLKHGADVNLIDNEKSGQRLLHSRIHWNLPSVVIWLLENGADPNLRDAKGNTAWHEAASRGVGAKILDALLKHGADARLKNDAGQTAADVARQKKSKGRP